MSVSYIVFVQVIILFILIFVGFFLTKIKMLTKSGVKQLTDIVLNIVTPCVLINAYQKEFSIKLIHNLFMAVVLSFVIHALAIVLSNIVFRKEKRLHYRIERFAAVYSNCGFMAIPLLTSAIGNDGVFYGSAYLAVFTLLYWTHGIYLYTEDKKELSFKSILKNPGIIGTTIALILFVFGIKLPYVLKEGVTYFANMNTPLGMIIIGSYLTKVDFLKAIKNVRMYLTIFIRLLAVPVLSIFIVKIIPIDPVVAKSIIICAAAPSASVTTFFAARYNLDTAYSTEIVSLCTILSIITIPLVMLFV